MGQVGCFFLGWIFEAVLFLAAAAAQNDQAQDQTGGQEGWEQVFGHLVIV